MKKAGGALGWSSVQVLSTGTPSGLGEDLGASAGEIMVKKWFCWNQELHGNLAQLVRCVKNQFCQDKEGNGSRVVV